MRIIVAQDGKLVIPVNKIIATRLKNWEIVVRLKGGEDFVVCSTEWDNTIKIDEVWETFWRWLHGDRSLFRFDWAAHPLPKEVAQ